MILGGGSGRCFRRGCHRASAPAAYASHATLPPPAQGSLPAGWLAFAGRGSNSPDRVERFQSALTSPSFPGLTLPQAGFMPTTPRVPRPSPSAAPAAAVPFLPTARSRARRGGLRRPSHGRDATPSRGRSSTTLAVAPPGQLGPRAVRVGVLSRDDPRGSAPPQAVVEEGQEASGPGRPGAAAGVHRAAPERAGGRSTRSTSRGLRG